MANNVLIRAEGLPQALSTLDANSRQILTEILAEELITLEEALRGPDPRSPGLGASPGQVDPNVGQDPNAPGSGLVPINTGRLLSSFEKIVNGTSAILTADAQSPRGGFFYASVARFEGGEEGEVEQLVTAEWEAMGQRVADRFERELSQKLGAV